ncbi:MAG: type II toxin-antitoxin system death-on-curing family toxin [Deltaproteobacteria bacterium]|nr:type II toxin-antitoxin system death-on-curing family toxin [Deltaproteobacteria bacterium]
MKEPEWLLREVVLAVHERLLAEFGGSAGIRDTGLLESALARPVNLYAYQSPELCELAASYAFGIVKNHPFVDGNKRSGFAAAAMFLELNGRRLTASEADATIRTLALAAGEMSEAEFATWLEGNSRVA